MTICPGCEQHPAECTCGPPIDMQEVFWKDFCKRVKLTFPFRVEVFMEPADQGRTSTETGKRRWQMAVELFVLERTTREPITVKTRQPIGDWLNDEDAEETLFSLLEVAFKHEIYESVWLNGKLARELHKTKVDHDDHEA